MFLIVTFCEQYGWLKMKNGLKGHDSGSIGGFHYGPRRYEAIPSMYIQNTAPEWGE